MNAEFIHFRTQSSYSMLESAIKIEALTNLAAQYNMPAVALTDRGNLFASLEFSLSATKKKIQPIQGVILNIKFSIDEENESESKIYDKNHHITDNYAECLLIAKDETGYKNLLKLVSNTFIKNDRSVCEHISIQDLEESNAGLVLLSGYTEGVVGRLLLKDQYSAAVKAASKFKEIFGDRFYFEIMRHGTKDEQQIESEYLAIANELQIPLIATNQVLFSDVSMHDAHDVLLCISEGVVKDQEDRKRVSNQCYFKSPSQMIELFSDLPEAIENTVHLAKRCYVMAEVHPPSLPNFTDGTSSEEELIREESAKGLEERLKLKFISESITQKNQEKIRAEYFERLDYELNIICKMQFSGYFLIVSDFICWSKENGIAVGPGRGSGAGSIIAWALKITDLDPIKFGLLFERFLNPERVSMPDFDIDFCQERREEVIEYVRNKYGDGRVGQIITFGKMQAKAVIKDVARVLSLPYAFADQLTELVPFNAINPVTLADAIRDVGELKNAANGRGLYNLSGENELIKQVLDTALILEGLHRHASTHAAGVVIANSNMIETVPLYKDSIDANLLIVQYSMKYCELAGLVKFDFLGLQTLTVITKCLNHLIKQDIHIDMDKLPYEDTKTYELLASGLSTGVFQFESAGMKSAIRKLKPDCIEDIIALGALYRPGPMENIPAYIACKHGKQEPDYLHPMLEPILKETNGVIIYQEQVMEIAKVLAGYSLGAADLLRRAMGKKVKAEMDAQEEIFVSGAIANKVDASQAKSIFATVAKFAGYGFNKSHASAYGVISYQTAYLKANFPVEFLVSCLNLDIDSSDKINIYLQEAKIFAIEIHAPSVNTSYGDFRIKFEDNGNKSIIFAIGAIKNVSKNFGKYIEEEREKNGKYKTVSDFLERMPPKLLNKRLLENIIRGGCFDELYENRNSLMNSVPAMLSYCSTYHQEKNSNQMSLINVNQVSNNIIKELEPLTKTQLAIQEFEVFGLFLSNHPLQDSFDVLAKMEVKNGPFVRDTLENGSHIAKMAGVIVKKDSRMSQRGRFITLLLSDPFGIYEVTIFSEEILKEYANLIHVKSEVVIECDIYKDDGGVRITAKKFHELKKFASGISHDLSLYPQNSQDLQNIIKILDQSKSLEQGNSNITIFLKQDNNYIAKVAVTDNFMLEMDNVKYLQQFSRA